MPVFDLPVLITWTGATGSPGTNTWSFRTAATTDTAGSLNQAIDALENFYTALQGKFPSSVTFQFQGEAVSQSTGDDTPELQGGLHTWQHSGTGGESYLPPSQCLVLNLKTAHYGRSGRGRKFIGPLRANVLQANGTPAESDRTDLAEAALNELVQTFTGPNDGAFCVYSPTLHESFDITGVGVPNLFGSLRSRRD